LRGFQVASGRAGTFVITSKSAAGGRCVPAIYVDNMPTDLDFLVDLLPRDVAAIEAYSSATAPGEFSLRAECGVLLVWTR
jgi:hypothetical protein